MFEKHRQAIIRHAEEAFPEESCGVIYDGRYIPLVNVDPEPEDHFSMSDADADRYGDDPLTEAVVHSHPDGPAWPSEHDMRSQIAWGKPYVICAHDGSAWQLIELGDHMLDLPLEGRKFIHGITDCYGVMRAWWKQEKGIIIPDVPRRAYWWNDEKDKSGEIVVPRENLYVDLMHTVGFEEVKIEHLSEVQPGWAGTYKLDRKTESHGLLYIGDGKLLHHMPNRLSRIDAAEFWAPKICRWMRRVEA